MTQNKNSKTKTAGRYIAANIAAVAVIAFLGFASVMVSISGTATSIAGSLLFAAILLLSAIMIADFIKTKGDFSRLAFFVPFVLLVLNSVVLVSGSRHAYFYLPVCFIIFAVSCLYANFRQSALCLLAMAVVIPTANLLGFPVFMGRIPPVHFAAVIMLYFTACLLLLAFVKSSTARFDRTIKDAGLLDSFLSSAPSYLVALDSSDRIMYLSRPAAHLAGIRNTGLAKGQSVADLFPGMESRIHSQNAEKDSELWDFTAEGRKRFFRITGREIPAGGKLVTMSEVTDTAEHGMIAVIKNNLKAGIFMMDRDFAIQESYSPVMEDMMGAGKLDGKRFTDLIAASITDEELDKVKEHLRMVFDHSFDKDILDDINPLDRLAYIAPDNTRKVFQCIFIAVEGWQAQDRILAAIYDITDQADTQEKLKQEERRNREPENIFELLGTDPAMFLEFQKDIESEFAHIDSILRSNRSRQEILMRLYHEMRLMRSNALAVGLKSFAGKLRQIESEIKDLRGIGTEVSFDNILHIAVEIENLVQEKEVFKLIINMVNSYSAHGRGGIEEFTESLGKAVGEMAAKAGKKARFAAAGIEAQAFEKLPMHIARKALMLLADNCVASIEMPGDRISAGKDATGTIRFSVKQNGSNLNIKLADDGRGIDFAGIKARALSMGLLSENGANDKNRLLAAMFSPAFAKTGTGSLHLVHERIHYAGGSIKVQTQAGKGTVFSIMLPAKNTEAAATLNPVAAGSPATRITKKKLGYTRLQ